MSLLRQSIDPCELACYSTVNFNEFEEYGVHQHRMIAVKIIHEPYVAYDGKLSMLVMDQVSDSNRVLRVEVL